MKRVLWLPFLLTACGETARVDERNASLDQVAAAVARADAGTVLKPGRWETRVTFGDFNSAAYREMLFDGVWGVAGRSGETTSCVLSEPGARPDMAMLAKVGRECRYDRFRMGATTIEAQMTCRPKDDQRVYIKLSGTYSPDHFELFMEADAPGRGKDDERIEFSTHLNSIRNGECRGHEEIIAAPLLLEQAGS